MSAEFKIVQTEPLTDFCQKAFEKLGIPSQDAFKGVKDWEKEKIALYFFS